MSNAAAAEGAAEAAPKKSKKTLIIIIVAVVLLLGAGGGGFVFWKMQKAKAEAEAAAAEDGEEGAPVKKAAPPPPKPAAKDPKALPVFFAVEPFTVNLTDRDGSRYAQVTVSLELDDAKTGDIVKGYMPAIRNNVLILLSQKSSAQLLDPQGKLKLAKEIQREVLKPLGYEMEEEDEEEESSAKPKKKKKKPRYEPEYPVRAVHFSNFIVQ